METKKITVDQIAEEIKMDFLYELGKEIIEKTDATPFADDPVNEEMNRHRTQLVAVYILDFLRIPADAFDHIFKKKAIETMENMLLEDLRDLTKEAAKEAILEADVDSMMARLMNVHSLSKAIELSEILYGRK